MNIRLTNMGEPRLVMFVKDDMSNINDIKNVLRLAGFNVEATCINLETPYWYISESGSAPGIGFGGMSPSSFMQRFGEAQYTTSVLNTKFDYCMSEPFKQFILTLRHRLGYESEDIINA